MSTCGNIDDVRTIGGATPAKPCGTGLWCNQGNVADWRAAADSKFRQYLLAWNRLWAAEKPPHAKAEALRARAEAYEVQYDAMPEPGVEHTFGGLNGEGSRDVSLLVENLREGVCMLKLLNDALASVGGDPVDPGPTLPEHGGGLLDGGADVARLVVGGAVVLGLAALLMRR